MKHLANQWPGKKNLEKPLRGETKKRFELGKGVLISKAGLERMLFPVCEILGMYTT